MTEAERLAAELDAVPENGADPELIADAAAELRRLEAEYCELSERHEVQAQNYMALAAEREQLRQALADLGVTLDEAKAGVERSRANRLDAARYRWMKQWVVQIPPGWERIGWDAAIDAAMEEAKAHGWTFSKEAAAAMKETK